jgi:hypothetical protein
MQDIRSILDPLPVDKSVKASAWDAFHAAKTPEELKSSLDTIALPKESKAALWDEWNLQNTSRENQPQTAKTWAQSLGIQGSGPTTAALDTAQGITAGVNSTVYNAADMIGQAFGKPGLMQKPSIQQAITAPPSIAGQFGKATEQTAEYFIPELGTGSFLKLTAKLNPVARFAAKAVYDGLTSGAVATAQTGSPKAGIEAGLTQSAFTIAAKPVEYLMRQVGSKIQMSTIRPRAVDYADLGTKDPRAMAQIIQKQNFKGNAADSFDQLTRNIEELRQQRNTLIASEFNPRDETGAFRMGPPDPGNVSQAVVDKADIAPAGLQRWGTGPSGSVETGKFADVQPLEDRMKYAYTAENRNPKAVSMGIDAATRAQQIEQINRGANLYKINLNEVFNKAQAQLSGEIEGLKVAGQSKQVQAAFEKLRADVMDVVGKDGIVNLERAEDAKEGFGLLGSWSYGRNDIDSAATEKAANTIYLHLKQAIENALPEGAVKNLNKRMQELIPVKNAMLARIPVEERNRMFSLADITSMIPALVSGNPAHLALLTATRAQKSLRFGNWLIRNMETPSKVAPALGRLASAGIAGINNQ